MPSLNDIRSRIEVVRYDPPAVGYKQMGVVIIALVLFAAGAFLAGGKYRDIWWRAQIATKSARAAAIEKECQSSCVDGDKRMIEALTHDLSRPAAAAEAALARARDEGRREAQARIATGAPTPRCTIAADCLRD